MPLPVVHHGPPAMQSTTKTRVTLMALALGAQGCDEVRGHHTTTMDTAEGGKGRGYFTLPSAVRCAKLF